TPTIDDLRRDNILWYKLHVFMYDLRHFRSNNACGSRLDAVVSEKYIGAPYFSVVESAKVLNTIINSATMEKLKDAIDKYFGERLAARLKGRMEETGDYRVCAAHDLAPIFEQAFRVNGRDLGMNKEFFEIGGEGALGALDKGG
ncbi:hypothetical protein K458DRAFT_261900, partial [Lentithecium fluviatile CBS 122367]